MNDPVISSNADSSRGGALRAVAAPFVIGLALVLCALILGRAWVRGRTGDETIRVVGSARKAIRSDFIIWRGRVTQTAPKVGPAYAALKTNIDKVRAYLLGKSIPPGEIVPTAITVKTLYVKPKGENSSYEESESGTGFYHAVAGYELSQAIEVRSSKVDLVDGVSREATELISQGIRFQSEAPMYLYTKLSDLKVAMQAEAAQDARARAEQIAANSGCHLGDVRFSRMSTPQITPLYSTQESDGGVDDTTALDKKITAVVTTGFGIR